MDVADKLSVKKCFEVLKEAGEKIDICINNAGMFKDGGISWGGHSL